VQQDVIVKGTERFDFSKRQNANSFREIVAHVNLRECGLSCDNGLFEHITLERVASC
jgi:hypothetical protein